MSSRERRTLRWITRILLRTTAVLILVAGFFSFAWFFSGLRSHYIINITDERLSGIETRSSSNPRLFFTRTQDTAFELVSKAVRFTIEIDPNLIRPNAVFFAENIDRTSALDLSISGPECASLSEVPSFSQRNTDDLGSAYKLTIPITCAIELFGKEELVFFITIRSDSEPVWEFMLDYEIIKNGYRNDGASL